MNIIIVDGVESERLRLETLMAGENGYKVVLSVASAEEALIYLTCNSANLVIIDPDLAGLSGAQAIKTIKSVAPSTEIMVLTFSEDDKKAFSALMAGATGYMLKNAKGCQVIDAIEAIKNGGSAISSSLARKVLLEFQQQLSYVRPKVKIFPLSRR